MIGGTGFQITSGTTMYAGATESLTEANAQVPVPAITAVELQVGSSVAPGSGETFVVTLRANGSDTALTATIGGTDTTASSTGSVAFSASDLLSVSIVSSSGAATGFVGFFLKANL